MKIAFLLFVSLTMSSWSAAPAGFGNRNAPETTESAPTPQKTPTEVKTASDPPSSKITNWMRVPFDAAENKVLVRFQRDLPNLEEITKDLAVYQVRMDGQMPSGYSKEFRTKLERVLLSSQTIRVRDCPGCESSRVVRESDGQLRFESSHFDPKRAKAIAENVGTHHFLNTVVHFRPEELRMEVRLVSADNGEILWLRQYSTSDTSRTEKRQNQVAGVSELGAQDSLSHVLLGEIAFTTVVSPGVFVLPTINTGDGSASTFYPSFDLLIGEKFDQGHKRFGFVFGAAINVGLFASRGRPLPFFLRVAPQYRYTFNPFNVSSVRWSLTGELGAVISAGVVTGYLGVGPELSMMKRFSVSLIPCYILPASVAAPAVLHQLPDGTFQPSSQGNIGKFGGFAVMAKGSINW